MFEFKLFQLFYLVFAHTIGDFALQHSNMVRYKREDPWMFFAHVMIWTGSIVFTLSILGIFETWHLPYLFFGHLWMDFVKPKIGVRRWVRNTIDQSFHLGQIIIIWLMSFL